MKNLANTFLGGKEGAIGLAILAVLILIVMPMFLDIFRLNLMGKYLTFAFVAIGLVLCWGHGGILSLGQGIFFGIPKCKQTVLDALVMGSEFPDFRPLQFFEKVVAYNSPFYLTYVVEYFFSCLFRYTFKELYCIFKE